MERCVISQTFSSSHECSCAVVVLRVETHLDSHLRPRMEQVADEPTGREPYTTQLHVQAQASTCELEVLQEHYIFNLKWKEEISQQKRMTCSTLHGALFESDYLALKARDVSVKTKYSDADSWKGKLIPFGLESETQSSSSKIPSYCKLSVFLFVLFKHIINHQVPTWLCNCQHFFCSE